MRPGRPRRTRERWRPPARPPPWRPPRRRARDASGRAWRWILTAGAAGGNPHGPRPDAFPRDSGGAVVVGRGVAGQELALPAVDADDDRTGDRHALGAPVRGPVVGDGHVLGGAVVPDRQVARAPAPADGV